MRIALLGDSTFDNGAYTDGGPDVATHLGRLLVGDDTAVLLARDGAMVAGVEEQVQALSAMCDPGAAPEPVTHVALSVGGNDLLAEAGVLNAPVASVGEALVLVRERSASFGSRYRSLLDRLMELRLKTVLCTVYNGAFPSDEARVIEAALRIFDHEIIEAGLARGVPIIDLRRVCSEPSDYFNPIEPSERGGAKIAAAVLRALHVPLYGLAGPAVTVQGTA